MSVKLIITKENGFGTFHDSQPMGESEDVIMFIKEGLNKNDLLRIWQLIREEIETYPEIINWDGIEKIKG